MYRKSSAFCQQISIKSPSLIININNRERERKQLLSISTSGAFRESSIVQREIDHSTIFLLLIDKQCAFEKDLRNTSKMRVCNHKIYDVQTFTKIYLNIKKMLR